MLMCGIERMNNINSVTPTTEDAMKHVTEGNPYHLPKYKFYA
jgi:hypothetical protein